MMDEDDLLRRAFAAHFRAGGPYSDQPSSLSEVVTYDGLTYVVLRGGSGGGPGPMRVYRVTNQGALRGLRRWPKELGE